MWPILFSEDQRERLTKEASLVPTSCPDHSNRPRFKTGSRRLSLSTCVVHNSHVGGETMRLVPAAVVNGSVEERRALGNCKFLSSSGICWCCCCCRIVVVVVVVVVACPWNANTPPKRESFSVLNHRPPNHHKRGSCARLQRGSRPTREQSRRLRNGVFPIGN